MIFYSEEPVSLKNAKNNIFGGHYEEALNVLSHLKTDLISRKELLEDIEFYTALSSAIWPSAGRARSPTPGG